MGWVLRGFSEGWALGWAEWLVKASEAILIYYMLLPPSDTFGISCYMWSICKCFLRSSGLIRLLRLTRGQEAKNGFRNFCQGALVNIACCKSSCWFLFLLFPPHVLTHHFGTLHSFCLRETWIWAKAYADPKRSYTKPSPKLNCLRKANPV